MIRYALQCDRDHPFEAWFGTSSDFDDQAERGLVECPFCASRSIRKQIMAPAVAGTKRTASPAETQTMMIEAAAQARRHVEKNFDYVGDRFAAEARRIHDGEGEPRGVYGEASPPEVKALIEDGIQVAPLPPALTPRPKKQVN